MSPCTTGRTAWPSATVIGLPSAWRTTVHRGSRVSPSNSSDESARHCGGVSSPGPPVCGSSSNAKSWNSTALVADVLCAVTKSPTSCTDAAPGSAWGSPICVKFSPSLLQEAVYRSPSRTIRTHAG
ncbi:Uncharacterised protein [Mycobacteroides abscessus]|nr:Uncharacterised protein [Mycobacteroides abscessus]